MTPPQIIAIALLLPFRIATAQPSPPEPVPRAPEPEPVGTALLAWEEQPREVEDGSVDERTDFYFLDDLPAGEIGFAVDSQSGWIEYRVDENRLILNVNARVAYEDMRLAADTVIYEAEAGEVEALGAPILIQDDDRVDGERMRYSFKSGRGLVYGGETAVEQGLATGTKLKLQAGDVLHIAGGTFTTSTRPVDPEYHFYCPRLKVYAGDKVIAKPVVLFIGHVPVAAAPYYYYPLGRERRSGFLAPRLGYRSRGNFTLRNAYYWAINDYADATFALDYDTERGWRQEIEGRYLYGTRWGMNFFRAVHDEDRSQGREWWSLSARHRQDLPWDINGLLQADLRTDRYSDYLYAEDIEDRTRSAYNSFLSLSRSFEKLSLSADVDYKASLVESETDDEDTGPTTWTVPRISASLSQSELFDTGAYLSSSLSFVNRLYSESDPFRNARLNLRLTRPFSLFRYFKFNPYANGSVDWYRIAADGSLNLFQPIYDAGVSFSTRIYGLFYPGDDELRHIIEPSAGLSWQPEIEDELVPSGGRRQRGSTSINLGLTNRIKIHFDAGRAEWAGEHDVESQDDEGEDDSSSGGGYGSESLELLRWDLSTGYYVSQQLEEENTYGTPFAHVPAEEIVAEGSWSDLTSRLYITPNFADWYDAMLSLNTKHDLYTGELEQFDLSAAFAVSGDGADAKLEDNEYVDPLDELPDYDPLDTAPPENELERRIDSGWRIGLSYDYTMGRYSSQDLQFLKAQAVFNLTDHWRVTYSNSLNLVTGNLVFQTFSIYRDMHSWEARLRLEERRGVISVWFLIDIKDIPDIRIEGRPELY